MVSSVHIYTVISMIVLASSTVRGDEWEVPSCKDKKFCSEKPEKYDSIQEELDAKISEISETFNLNTFDESDMDETPDDYYNGMNCASKTEIVKPYTVKVNSTTKVIVQSKFFEQKFKKTICDFEAMDNSPYEAKCFDGISTAFSPKCKQKFTSITLYLYDTNNQKIQRHPVQVPVCCYCDISGD